MALPSEFGVRESDLTEMVLPNDLYAAKRSEDRIMRELARCAYSGDVIFAIKLALEEALTNAVKHGNSNDATKRLTVRYSVNRERTVIMVRDEGVGFTPARVPDPTADENLECPSGRGIMLMQAYMTRVHFNPAGNEVWMLKTNPKGRAAQSSA